MKKILVVFIFILTSTVVAQTQNQVNHFEKDQVTVYPSTFTDVLNIELSSVLLGQTLELQLFDQLGKLVFSDTLISNSTTISLRSLPEDMSTGIYYLKFSSGNYEETFKLLRD